MRSPWILLTALLLGVGCGDSAIKVGDESGVIMLRLSNVGASSITASSAVVTWGTNVAATSHVEYGTSIAYSKSTPLYGLSTSHSIDLAGLQAGTAYHFAVRSKD